LQTGLALASKLCQALEQEVTMSWSTEIKPLDGHEHLTMGDQMRAATLSQGPHTSPNNGAVTNPRREFLKQRIAARRELTQPKSGASTGSVIADDT
jgi:hypothetical protein